jgi:hypothetical protein
MDNQVREYVHSLNIQEFRLSSGDHIIAEILIDEESSGIVLKDPIQISINAEGYRTFAEWFVFTEDQYFVIDNSNVIASGGVDFLSKLLFCKMVLTRTIKNKLLSGEQSDMSELELLKQLQILISETTSKSKMGDSADEGEEGIFYDNITSSENTSSIDMDWIKMVDTSIKH